MEPGMRSGNGVVVKNRNSSGCLVVRKKGDGLGASVTATAGVGSSASRKFYESNKRANINMPLSDSGSSDDLPMPMPPGRRLDPETIRLCNGLTTFERGVIGGSEISRKRNRMEQIRGNGEGMIAENALDTRERKRNKLDMFHYYEYEGMDVEKVRSRHFDNNGVGRTWLVGTVSTPPHSQWISTPSPASSSNQGNSNPKQHFVIIWSTVVGFSFLVLVSATVFICFRSSKVVIVKPWSTRLSGQLRKAFVMVLNEQNLK